MKYLFVVIIFIAGAAQADQDPSQQGWPQDPRQERIETKGQAYNKALGQAVKDPKKAACYYSTKGCDKKTLAANNALQVEERPPVKFPQDGYALQADGLYHFQPNTFGRHY